VWQLLQMLMVAVTVLQTAPARSPEVQKLDAFLGEWRMKDDPPDAPNRTICQWAPNGRCLLCDQIHPGADGPVKELNIFTYDRAQSAYVMQGMRPSRRAPFSIEGQTWTYGGGSYTDHGKTLTSRVLNVWESPEVMHYLVQASQDGGTQWTTNAEGRMVRTKPPTPGATAPTAGTPAPASPEQRLNPLVGTWQMAGTRSATAQGSGGAIASTSTCGWSPNGAFLICDQLVADADLLLVYSAADAAGSRYQVQSLSPESSTSRALDLTITDRVWIYTTTSEGTRVRITKTLTSPDVLRGKEEVSANGTLWITRAEWTETKAK
jgi:hypothetical protein